MPLFPLHPLGLRRIRLLVEPLVERPVRGDKQVREGGDAAAVRTMASTIAQSSAVPFLPEKPWPMSSVEVAAGKTP
jgi:hypothetical protein